MNKRRILKDRLHLARYILLKLNKGCPRCGEMKGVQKLADKIGMNNRALIHFLTFQVNPHDDTISKIEMYIWRELNKGEIYIEK